MRNRVGRTAELDQRETEIDERAHVPGIVAARPFELHARLRQLALLGECQTEPGPDLGVVRLLGQHQLELLGGGGWTPRLQ